MILGILWLATENPPIDWTKAKVVVKEGQKSLTLQLAKPQKGIPDHLANSLSAIQVSPML